MARVNFWSRPSGDSKRPASRSIPSLDGLRAISVGMVILSHFMGFSNLSTHGLVHTVLSVAGQGGLGVSTFFVISGFLITTLLLNELDHHGDINLRRFYFRRSLRIFPPYYVYLAVAALVGYLALHPIPVHAFIAAAAYVSNYYPYIYSQPGSTGWAVGHTWSLSVEEQFYLFWPLLLVMFARKSALKCGLGIMVVAPILRLLTYCLLPIYGEEEQWLRLFHTSIDILMAGCMLAFLVRRPDFKERVQRYFNPAILGVAVAYLLLANFILRRAPSWFEALFGVTLTTLSIAILLLYVVIRHESPAGRVLNWAPLRHVGMISYSLYLWQQMFLGPFHEPSRLSMVFAAFACAELSYWVVERPSMRFRSRLEKKLGFLESSKS